MKHITLFAAMAFTLSLNAQVVDGSFEAGIGAGTWEEASVNFGTPLCDAGCGTCGGPCVPRTGDFYAWFGGNNGPETGSVSQDVNIPAGTSAQILMWVKMPALGDGSDNNYLRLVVDGNEIDRLTPADSVTYQAAYTVWAVPVDAYADGGVHTVLIEGVQAVQGFNVLVDDVSLFVDGTEIVGLFENENLSGVSIYPNPANDVINFSFNNLSGNVQVSVVDLTGKLVVRKQLNDVSGRLFQLDTKQFVQGLYMISVQQDQKIFTERVIVAH